MAKVPILWVDSTGKFILVNEDACRFAGYSREEFLSLSVPDIMPEYNASNLRDWIQEISERGALTFESTVRTKEGNILPIEITASFLRLNSREYFSTFFRDITERCQAERALKSSEKHYRTIFETTGAATMILKGGEPSQAARKGPLAGGGRPRAD